MNTYYVKYHTNPRNKVIKPGISPNYVTVCCRSSISCLRHHFVFSGILPERWHNTPLASLFRISSGFSSFSLLFSTLFPRALFFALSPRGIFFVHAFVPARSAIFIVLFRYRSFEFFIEILVGYFWIEFLCERKARSKMDRRYWDRIFPVLLRFCSCKVFKSV